MSLVALTTATASAATAAAAASSGLDRIAAFSAPNAVVSTPVAPAAAVLAPAIAVVPAVLAAFAVVSAWVARAEAAITVFRFFQLSARPPTKPCNPWIKAVVCWTFSKARFTSSLSSPNNPIPAVTA